MSSRPRRAYMSMRTGRSETLAGFVMNELGEIPEIGDVVTVGGVSVEVVAMQGRRVTRLHVTPVLDPNRTEAGRGGRRMSPVLGLSLTVVFLLAQRLLCSSRVCDSSRRSQL